MRPLKRTPVMVKQNFQQSLLQSSVPHDCAEIIIMCWFAAQKNSYFYQCRKNIFVETVMHLRFDEKKVQKNSIYFATLYVSVSLDQFHASL